MCRCAGALLLIVVTSVPSGAGVLSVDEALTKMDAANQTIDSFSCSFTLTKQVHVRSAKDAQGKPHAVPLDDPAEQRPPRVQRFQVIVSGKQFRKVLLAPGSPGPLMEETWDGSTLTRFDPGPPARAYISNRLGAADLRVTDPRDFAYGLNATAAIPDMLRSFPRREQISIRETTENNRPILLVEAVSEEARISGVRLWIDPTVGFLPVQIERTRGPITTDRFTAIEHKQIDGVWFPVGGTFQNLMSRAEADRDRIASSTRMQVDVQTIKLNPGTSSDTFAMSLPAGTSVVNTTTRQRYITPGGTAGDDVVRQSVRDGKKAVTTRPAPASGEPQSMLPAAPPTRNASYTKRYAVWCVFLVLAGFSVSWATARARGQ